MWKESQGFSVYCWLFVRHGITGSWRMWEKPVASIVWKEQSPNTLYICHPDDFNQTLYAHRQGLEGNFKKKKNWFSEMDRWIVSFVSSVFLFLFSFFVCFFKIGLVIKENCTLLEEICNKIHHFQFVRE